MNAPQIVRPASFKDLEFLGLGGLGYCQGRPAIFHIDGMLFYSAAPETAGEAASINNAIEALAHFQPSNPIANSRRVFQ